MSKLFFRELFRNHLRYVRFHQTTMQATTVVGGLSRGVYRRRKKAGSEGKAEAQAIEIEKKEFSETIRWDARFIASVPGNELPGY